MDAALRSRTGSTELTCRTRHRFAQQLANVNIWQRHHGPHGYVRKRPLRHPGRIRWRCVQATRSFDNGVAGPGQEGPGLPKS